MADLSITAANVVRVDGDTEPGLAGATITAGQAVYRDSADSKFKLADTNSATAAARDLYGIAMHGASSGQPLIVQRTGKLAIGATVTVGKIYVLSATAGGIAPSDDLASGHYTSIVGIGVSVTEISLFIKNGGVAVP